MKTEARNGSAFVYLWIGNAYRRI